MPGEQTFERVTDPADPNRCQAVHGSIGQCPYKAVEGSKYCIRHGANNVTDPPTASGITESRRKYLVAQWQDKIGKQADHAEIKNLSEEIGVLRMLLENKLDSCKTQMDLLMAGGAITQYVRDITVSVEKWHKIEMQTNQVMDKAQALDFVHALGDIISKYITDSEALRKISEAMIDEVARRTNYQLRRRD